MGISGSFGKLNNSSSVSITIFVSTLAFIAQFASYPLSAEIGGNATLETIARLNSFIAKKMKSSSFYKLHGKLFVADFGKPYLSWQDAGRPFSNPHNHLFKNLIALSVCQEKRAALVALNAINSEISSGLFGELETKYLQWLATKKGLKLDFQSVWQGRGRSTPRNSLREIDRRRS